MNLYDYSIPESGEAFVTLLSHDKIRIERIVSSDRLESKTYLQEEDEWVILLEGEAVLEVSGEQRRLCRGDMVLIPAGTPHRVLQTQKGTVWLAVHISGTTS